MKMGEMEMGMGSLEMGSLAEMTRWRWDRWWRWRMEMGGSLSETKMGSSGGAEEDDGCGSGGRKWGAV